MRETRGDSTVELHIGAKVSLAGGKIVGTVLAHRGRCVTILLDDGKKMRIEKRLIETILEAFV
jgi:preprotein translocase subunit YajC